jgi:hypothetical protein
MGLMGFFELTIVGLVLLVIFVVVLGKAVAKTFMRQPVVAALMLIFLLPIWMIWVVVEVFTGPVE